tara:strand:+ start:499 stop:714 length:216 start_codon:yes stop_codon:yes gene_type:complete
MNNISKDEVKELIGMKELTVKDFIKRIEQHPTLNGLLTTAGVWLMLRTLLFIMILANVIYVVYRIFNMVLN